VLWTFCGLVADLFDVCLLPEHVRVLWICCRRSICRRTTCCSFVPRQVARTATHTHTHPFNGPLSRTARVGRYQKGKPIWILLKQETVSGSEIRWAICKSAPCSRQIGLTTPAPHRSVFLQAGCPSCRPTNSVKALKARTETPQLIEVMESEP